MTGLFRLNSSQGTNIKGENVRALGYFIAHFPLMTCVIILLQGKKSRSMSSNEVASLTIIAIATSFSSAVSCIRRYLVQGTNTALSRLQRQLTPCRVRH